MRFAFTAQTRDRLAEPEGPRFLDRIEPRASREDSEEIKLDGEYFHEKSVKLYVIYFNSISTTWGNEKQ